MICLCAPFSSENLIEMLLSPDKDISHVITSDSCCETQQGGVIQKKRKKRRPIQNKRGQ